MNSWIDVWMGKLVFSLQMTVLIAIVLNKKSGSSSKSEQLQLDKFSSSTAPPAPGQKTFPQIPKKHILECTKKKCQQQ